MNTPDINILNIDCMDLMRSKPDGYYDLAIVDPPYGGGDKSKNAYTFGTGKNGRFAKYQNQQNAALANSNIIMWDKAPSQEYFDELFRVSKAQIIWGGNYFSLPPTRCFLIWRKLTISEGFSMAMAEYAWTSFNSHAKVFECAPQEKYNDARFHPTQKPLDLYRWIFNLYAKRGMRILDTHGGSMPTAIVAREYGCHCDTCEINEYYYHKGVKRYERLARQGILDLA